LRRLVHSLAGAGAVFGFPAISEAAGDCDDAFAQDRTPDPALIETLAQAIRDALARRQG
jgi:HPt (histidine-containing phosphotransfer) domain-containing protein